MSGKVVHHGGGCLQAITIAGLVAACSALSFAASGSAEEPLRPAADPLSIPFPDELVRFQPEPRNPLFTGTGQDTWDKRIRERGYILRVGNQYHLWYTGYNEARSPLRLLGHAVSDDGVHWRRDPRNPLLPQTWVEDMHVVRRKGTFYMFAEGVADHAHLLTSNDGTRWTDKGELRIRQPDGSPLSPGPFGTPTAWHEGGIWYLFFERRDEGVWLATSRDLRTWTLVQDFPVLARGPDRYDSQAVALNQIVKYWGVYYAYYHANAHRPWADWTTNVAASSDLIHWQKYPGNPIIKNNRSSGILVHDGRGWRMYTMHPEVCLFWPPERRDQRQPLK